MKKIFILCVLVWGCLWLLNAQTNDETAIKINSGCNVGINEPDLDKQLVSNGETEINGETEANITLAVNCKAQIKTLTVANVVNAHIPSRLIVMWTGTDLVKKQDSDNHALFA